MFDRARELTADADSDVELDTEVAVGHPVRAILSRADNYDTVVIGSHGGTVADRLFVGNVAEKGLLSIAGSSDSRSTRQTGPVEAEVIRLSTPAKYAPCIQHTTPISHREFRHG